METAHKIALCRIVGVLLVTDGQLTDDEYDFFYALMDRFELDAAARAEVTGAIRIDADLAPDIATLEEAGHGGTLLETLRSAAVADGEASSVEQQIIDRVAELLTRSP